MVPLIVTQPASEVVGGLLQKDGDVAAWWGTWTECAVVISRLKREGRLDEEAEEESRVALDRLAENWSEVRPVNELRLMAVLISEDYPLKAADCLQLAAALRWCEGDTSGSGFVCLDERLRRAAFDEGFDILPDEEAAA